MSANGEMGVVVVGYGMVGKIRCRDVNKCATDPEFASSPLSKLRLRGAVTRRPQEGVTDVEFTSLETALSRADVQLVIVTTENSSHYDIARQAIEAGKNVLVEFPLTISADNSASLLKLARQKGVICYEENLSLILKAFEQIKTTLETSPPVKHSTVQVTGKTGTGWKATVEKSGSPFMSQVSLLQDLLLFYGELTAVEASIKRTEDSMLAEGTLRTKNNSEVKVVIDKSPSNGMRKVEFSATFEDGTKFETPLDAGPDERKGLFMRDLERCVTTVLRQREQNEWVVTRSAELAEQLTQLAQK